MIPTHAAPAVGERLPLFSLPSTSGGSLDLDDVIGKPFVLAVYAPAPGDAHVAGLLELARHTPTLKELGARVVVVGSQSPDEQASLVRQHALPFPLLSDPSGRISGILGAATGSGLRRVLLLSPSMRVWAAYDSPADSQWIDTLLAEARRRLQEPGRRVLQQAPVLLIPDAVSARTCQRLMDAWAADNQETGTVGLEAGQNIAGINRTMKIRRDHFLKPGELQSTVVGELSRRVLPEIAMAFHFNVTRSEGLRVGCYDSTVGGYFRAHRDNTSPSTVYRRFAMSLLLNDEYEDGYLRFPEYGPHYYRPGAGGAVIFSCSLLHEATPVTGGRRFVLLDFFFGEGEARQYEAAMRNPGAARPAYDAARAANPARP